MNKAFLRKYLVSEKRVLGEMLQYCIKDKEWSQCDAKPILRELSIINKALNELNK